MRRAVRRWHRRRRRGAGRPDQPAMPSRPRGIRGDGRGCFSEGWGLLMAKSGDFRGHQWGPQMALSGTSSWPRTPVGGILEWPFCDLLEWPEKCHLTRKMRYRSLPAHTPVFRTPVSDLCPAGRASWSTRPPVASGNTRPLALHALIFDVGPREIHQGHRKREEPTTWSSASIVRVWRPGSNSPQLLQNPGSAKKEIVRVCLTTRSTWS